MEIRKQYRHIRGVRMIRMVDVVPKTTAIHDSVVAAVRDTLDAGNDAEVHHVKEWGGKVKLRITYDPDTASASLITVLTDSNSFDSKVITTIAATEDPHKVRAAAVVARTRRINAGTAGNITSEEAHRLDLIIKITEIPISTESHTRIATSYTQAESIYNLLRHKMELINANLRSRKLEATKENIAVLNAMTDAQIIAGTVRNPVIDPRH